MITFDQAMDDTITEFHIGHDALPCTVWHRGGMTMRMHDDASMPGWLTDNTGGFFLPILRNEGDPASLRRDSQTQWHHITGVNASDFHVADECPNARRMGDDRPPIGSDQSEHQPMLASGYGEDGYDALGFNAEGFDRNGYDVNGYDVDGYDVDGYDADDRDADGDPRPGTLDASDLDLADQWAEFTGGSSSYNRWSVTSSQQRRFREHLQALVREPSDIDELSFCGNCHEPAWDDDLRGAMGGDISICESCWDDWMYCDRCEERYDPSDLHETLGGSDICESCRNGYYTYCDYCDGYYPDDYAEDHEHDSSGMGCCDSPQTDFRVRNDGSDPLPNDTKITITLPAGTISAEGLQAISRYLRDQGQFDVSYSLDELGDQWQSRQGNFAKRLSRLAYQKYQAKLTPDILSQIGNIARDHSNSVSVTFEVSRELNQDAADWYHEDSCYWGSYYESRCALKTNGGFGLRSFTGEDRYASVNGRAWVIPLRKTEDGQLVATFETLAPDAFVVFNGYGDMSGYAAPRIVAHMAGWTYRKIGFSADPMYINAGGYLIAPEDIAEGYTDGHLSLSVRQHSNLFETERQLSHA